MEYNRQEEQKRWDILEQRCNNRFEKSDRVQEAAIAYAEILVAAKIAGKAPITLPPAKQVVF